MWEKQKQEANGRGFYPPPSEPPGSIARGQLGRVAPREVARRSPRCWATPDDSQSLIEEARTAASRAKRRGKEQKKAVEMRRPRSRLKGMLFHGQASVSPVSVRLSRPSGRRERTGFRRLGPKNATKLQRAVERPSTKHSTSPYPCILCRGARLLSRVRSLSEERSMRQGTRRQGRTARLRRGIGGMRRVAERVTALAVLPNMVGNTHSGRVMRRWGEGGRSWGRERVDGGEAP